MDNDGVGSALVEKMKEPDGIRNLGIVQKDIYCNINLDTPDMGKMNCPAEITIIKVTGGLPGIEELASQVNSIRPVFHGGHQRIPFAGRC